MARGPPGRARPAHRLFPRTRSRRATDVTGARPCHGPREAGRLFVERSAWRLAPECPLRTWSPCSTSGSRETPARSAERSVPCGGAVVPVTGLPRSPATCLRRGRDLQNPAMQTMGLTDGRVRSCSRRFLEPSPRPLSSSGSSALMCPQRARCCLWPTAETAIRESRSRSKRFQQASGGSPTRNDGIRAPFSKDGSSSRSPTASRLSAVPGGWCRFGRIRFCRSSSRLSDSPSARTASSCANWSFAPIVAIAR